MLFRLKDATLGADNAPEWTDLFVQGVANHLTAHNHFQPLSTERARELDGFMNDTTPRMGAFFGRMAKADLGGSFSDAAGRVLGFGRKGAGRDHAAAVADDARITEEEEAWLQGKVEANRELDSLDKALLRFLAAEERRR